MREEKINLNEILLSRKFIAGRRENQQLHGLLIGTTDIVCVI